MIKPAVVACFAAVLLPTFPAFAGPITVIDGDTVERDGERWR